jgi:hypothetical protein
MTRREFHIRPEETLLDRPCYAAKVNRSDTDYVVKLTACRAEIFKS